ncbi:hypothetical protein NA8A_23342 [Nitratireductor indicus C115]|uniref:Uncharacterized protein n=2 Tax=Nitratireductor indicus TaxID=721133 RepID=K2NQ21_9HYPH|nr:hypothetical protein NA8A_23342 [Nitratireductor indicus C115]
MAIEITIDRSKAGEIVPWQLSNAGSPGADSYSWIIDPSCYVLAPWTLRPLDTRTINSGRDFPLLAATRAGVTSIANAFFNGTFLDCKVRGAIPGKYYQIGYMQNGATLGGDSDDGVVIQEFDAADYASTGTPTVIQFYNDPAPTVNRGGGVQSLVYEPPARPGLTIELVLDDALLPPQGTPVIGGYHANNGFAAWSWIIDPICYEYAAEAGNSASVYGPMRVQIDPLNETASLIWSHGDDEMLRLRLGHVGKNDLFNIAGYDRASTGPIPSAVWSAIVDTETDFFPPLIFHSTEAVVDEGAVQIYTGGNHGSDGNSGGSITASPLSWSCEIDGRALGEYFEGAAQRVVFRFTNQVMAWNTWSLPRYALRQHFTVIVTPGSLEFWAEVEALENITVQTDNGLQLLKNGYETVAFYEGDTAVRRPIADDWNAGPRSAAPNAWAGVLASPTNGYMASWMDRAYEAGDGRNLDPESPFIRTTPGKIYHAIVAAHATPMAPGAFYRYHGGYTWAPKTIVSGDLDSALLFMKSDKPHLAYAFLAAGSGTIMLPRDFVGKAVGSQVISATNKIDVSAPGTDYADEAIT